MHQSDRAGLLYALAGFCTLSIGDAIIKGMAGEWPAPAMAAMRYVVGTALLETLRVMSGEKYDPETATAWTNVYELISETMIRGARLLQNADDQTTNLLAATTAQPFGDDPPGLSQN